jgi:ABC-2 type transport system permease protein
MLNPELGMTRRVGALLRKELLDALRNRAALFPVALVAAISVILPAIVVFAIPALTGRGLGDDLVMADLSRAATPDVTLSEDGQVQVFMFQQFLLLFLLTPISGAMALAAHAIVGEKQARTLEPLLATPITTVELLTAKVLGALIPTLLISVIGLTAYFGTIVAFAEPGVATAMMTARTLLLIAVVGPGAALGSLQLALLVSSRVSDARTAQQFGVLIILPLTALLVAQFAGAVWVSTAVIGLLGLGLIALWVVLLLLSVAIFDRERILTRWR